MNEGIDKPRSTTYGRHFKWDSFLRDILILFVSYALLNVLSNAVILSGFNSYSVQPAENTALKLYAAFSAFNLFLVFLNKQSVLWGLISVVTIALSRVTFIAKGDYITGFPYNVMELVSGISLLKIWLILTILESISAIFKIKDSTKSSVIVFCLLAFFASRYFTSKYSIRAGAMVYSVYILYLAFFNASNIEKALYFLIMLLLFFLQMYAIVFC